MRRHIFRALADGAPVLFLDIDGVLNKKDSFDKVALSTTIDPALADVLNTVLDRVPECLVVASTSWRSAVTGAQVYGKGLARWTGLMDLDGFEFLLRTHRLHVAGRLAGCTPPDDEVRGRAAQISAWLERNPHGPWAAVDDYEGDDMMALGGRLVRTDPNVGLSVCNADRLVALLRGA